MCDVMRAPFWQRLLGNLDDDFLAFLQKIADRRQSCLFATCIAACIAARFGARFRPAFRTSFGAAFRATLGARTGALLGTAAFLRTALAFRQRTAISAALAPGAARNAVRVAGPLLAQGGGQAGGNARRLGAFVLDDCFPALAFRLLLAAFGFEFLAGLALDFTLAFAFRFALGVGFAGGLHGFQGFPFGGCFFDLERSETGFERHHLQGLFGGSSHVRHFTACFLGDRGGSSIAGSTIAGSQSPARRLPVSSRAARPGPGGAAGSGFDAGLGGFGSANALPVRLQGHPCTWRGSPGSTRTSCSIEYHTQLAGGLFGASGAAPGFLADFASCRGE